MSDIENPEEQGTKAEPETVTNRYAFYSSFSHGLDSKSRVVVPISYRAALGSKFVIAPSLDFESIALYPTEVWQREIDKLHRKSQKSMAVAGQFLRHFSKYSFPDCEPDSQGRTLIPARIKALYLGDAKEVVIAGNVDHILIEAQEKVDVQDKAFMLNKAELLKQLDMIDD